MSVTYKSVLDTTLEDWRRDARVNTEAVFIGTREALRIMIPQKRGSIINIASANGIRAMPGMCSYSASKAALIQFSAVAAMEAAPSGVRVNVIAPGQILTPAVEEFAKSDPETGQPQRCAHPHAAQRPAAGAGQCRAVSGLRRVDLHHRHLHGRRRR